MANSSLLINATDQAGNKLQRSVTCTAEDAARDKLLTFAQGLNGLLTNNFVEAKRVQKVDLDTEPDGGWKPGGSGGYEVVPYPEATTTPDESKNTPTITLSPTTITRESINQALDNDNHYDVTIAYDGDGELYIDYVPTNANLPVGAAIINGNTLRIFKDGTMNGSTVQIIFNYIVRSTTTATCNPASATFSVV